MQHTVTQPRAPFLTADGALRVHQLLSLQDNLVWLLECTATGFVAVVDGPEPSAVQAWCAARGRQLGAILNTHTHWDHIGINKALQAAGALDGVEVWGAASRADEIPGLTHPLQDGDEVRVGQARGRVMATPGHIDGHLSFVFSDCVFCGDTMFAAGCGYLFDGPPAKMHQSLQRLAALPEQTKVCCAHEYTLDNLRFAWSVEPGNPALAARIEETRSLRAAGGCAVPSTIGLERATNPFLRTESAELQAQLRAAWPERVLDTSAARFAATRALKDRKDYRALPDITRPDAQ